MSARSSCTSHPLFNLESTSSSSVIGSELFAWSPGLIDWPGAAASVLRTLLALGLSTVLELATSFDDDLVAVFDTGVTPSDGGEGGALKSMGFHRKRIYH